MKTQVSKLVLIVLLAALSLGFLIGWLSNYTTGRASLSWPMTPGTITLSRLETRTRKNATRYYPDILYHYTVDGKQYTGMLIWTTPSFTLFDLALGDNPSSDAREDIDLILDRYSLGQEVMVYYDPSRPAVAALEPGIPPGTERQLILGVFLGLSVIIIGIVFR